MENGITVTETGIATTGTAQSFSIFAETSTPEFLRTGIAIANTSPDPNGASVRFELRDLNGQPTNYSANMIIPANGHLSLFLNEIPGFEGVPASFRGVLNVTNNRAISAID